MAKVEGISLYLFVLVVSKYLFGNADLETFLAISFEDEKEKDEGADQPSYVWEEGINFVELPLKFWTFAWLKQKDLGVGISTCNKVGSNEGLGNSGDIVMVIKFPGHNTLVRLDLILPDVAKGIGTQGGTKSDDVLILQIVFFVVLASGVDCCINHWQYQLKCAESTLSSCKLWVIRAGLVSVICSCASRNS